MADGKVVIDVVLNDGSVAKGIANIDGIGKSGERAGLGIGKMVTALGLVEVASAALGVVKNSLDSAISRFDTMQKFPKVMSALGFSSEDSSKSIKKLSDGIDGLPTKLDDVVASTQQLTSITGDLDKSTDTVLALNNAFLASGASTEDANRGMQQYNQMLSSGTVDLESWKTLQETMPLALQKTAEAMGFVGKSAQRDLYAALKNGTITFDQFQDKLIELGTGTGMLAGLAKENSLGIATSFNNLKNAVAKNVANIITKVDDITKKMTGKSIAQNIDSLKVVINSAFKSIIDNMDKVIPYIEKVVQVFKTLFNFISENKEIVISAITGIVGAMLALSAINKVNSTISGVSKAIGLLSSPIGITVIALTALIGAFVYLWQTSETFRNKVTKVFEDIKKSIQALDFDKLKDIGKISGVIAGVVAAAKGLNVIKNINPFSSLKKKSEESLNGVTKATKGSKNVIVNVLNSISGIIKSSGEAIKKSAIGIGQGISTAFKGIGSALKTAGVQNILALGASVGIAAVGIGAGIAIIISSLALLSTQSKGASEIITAIGGAISSIASTIISAFAQAIISVSSVLPTITNSLVQLSPLVIAIGQAFSLASPFVVALGAAVSQVVGVIVAALPSIINSVSNLVTSVSNGISQFATAITPIVQIITGAIVSIVQTIAPYIPNITQMFTTIAQVVSQAIVDIITALAPFIPEVTRIVEALAPIIQSIVDSFTNIVNKISPIIDSITKLLKTFGEQVKIIFDSVGGVIESIGTSIKSVLDGVAGIFDSIGNAALNAGNGVKAMAQGIKILVDLKLGDLIATLAATAKGLQNIANKSDGISTAGNAVKNLGQGFLLIANYGSLAMTSLSTIGASLSGLQANLSGIPAILITAAVSFGNFASQTLVSAMSLMQVVTPINYLKSQLISIIPSVLSSSSSMMMLGSVSSSVSGAINSLGNSFAKTVASSSALTSVLNSLSNTTNLVSNSFVIMSQSCQNSMNTLINLIKSGFQTSANEIKSSSQNMVNYFKQNISKLSSDASVAISNVVNTVRNGRSSMYSAGSYMAQGLAEGMRSALASVTEAANELVNQAERAAKAKADIHSPSRLFRDEVGLFMGQGIAEGIDKSKKNVDSSMRNIVLPSVSAESVLSSRVSVIGASNSVTNNYYQTQSNNSMLEALNKLANRPIVTNIDVDSTNVARATSKAMTQQQYYDERTDNRMRGILI